MDLLSTKKSSQMSYKTIKTLTTWQPFLFKGNFIFDYATFNVDGTPEKMSLLTLKLPISHLYSGTLKHLSTKSNQT